MRQSVCWACFGLTIQLQAHTDKKVLHLHPLARVPHLTSFEIEDGTCYRLCSLQHLTKLTAAESVLDCHVNCARVTSLVNLYLRNSRLDAFHTSGLPACSKLQQLELCDAYIQAGDVDETTTSDWTGFLVPLGLSALTALTSLAITYNCSSKLISLQWLSHLPTLQSVSFTAEVERMTVPASISQLSKTTYLHLSNDARNGHIQASCKWSDLVALQVLSIRGRTHSDEDLCDLATLAFLTSVELEMLGTQHCDRYMALQVVQLGHRLGVARTDVKFVVKWPTLQCQCDL